MEQATSTLLQVLALLIASVEKIPATFWGVVFGAGLALGGVILSNRGNTARLERQLAHDRAVKRAEREFNTKRDIYLDTSEAIALALRSLSNFAVLSMSNEDLMKEYTAKSGAIAKVQLIGTPKTIAALNAFNMYMSSAVIQLTELRTPLIVERSQRMVKDNVIAEAHRDFDAAIHAFKQFDLSGEVDLAKRLRLESNSEYAFKRMSDLREGHSKMANSLSEKAMGVYKTTLVLRAEAMELLPALIEAIREELELPIDTTVLVDVQNLASFQMADIGERMEGILQAAIGRKK